VIPECKKRIHFRTDMEHYICRPVNNSDVSLGYQFWKNITFILYIIYNVRYNNTICKIEKQLVINYSTSIYHWLVVQDKQVHI
jgi:hypothetical protein